MVISSFNELPPIKNYEGDDAGTGMTGIALRQE